MTVDVVEITLTLIEPAWLSLTWTAQVPAATCATERVAFGPFAGDKVTVAMPAHVSLSENAPAYPDSLITSLVTVGAPFPSAMLVVLAFSEP